MYKELLPGFGGYLTHAGQLHRGRLQVLLDRIGALELDTLEMRAKVRKYTQHPHPCRSQVHKAMKVHSFIVTAEFRFPNSHIMEHNPRSLVCYSHNFIQYPQLIYVFIATSILFISRTPVFQSNALIWCNMLTHLSPPAHPCQSQPSYFAHRTPSFLRRRRLVAAGTDRVVVVTVTGDPALDRRQGDLLRRQ